MASSNEGDIILDPFCGSATTGVVAICYKRKFVGIDSEKNYLNNLAIPRLKDELSLRNQDGSFETIVKDSSHEYRILP